MVNAIRSSEYTCRYLSFIIFIYSNYKMKQVKRSQANHNWFRIKPIATALQYIKIEHYLIGELIGKGGCANVHKAIQLHTNLQVAVKIIHIQALQPHQVEHVRKQIFIHSKLSHPNIAKIYEAIWTDTHVYIVMEYIQGFQLYNYLSKFGALSEQIAAKIFWQIVNATEYLHSMNIAHRDIKTQNIMIDHNFNAKLIDFGLAKAYKSRQDDYLLTICGSPSYISPQIMEMKGYSGQAVDVWCLAVTLYVMLEACLPFEEQNERESQRKIKDMLWHTPLNSSEEAKQLYRLIFVREEERLSMKGLKQSSLFLKYQYNKKENEKRIKKSQLITRITEKVCHSLNIKEAQIRKVVQEKNIGQIFCVYNLLLQQNGVLCDQINLQKSYHSEEKFKDSSKDKKQKQSRERRSQTKPKQTINSKRNKATLSIFDGKTKEMYQRKEKYEENKDLVRSIGVDCYQIGKDKVAKQLKTLTVSRMRNYRQKTNIKVAIPIFARPRDDVDGNPKRILDCVKKYN